MLRMAIIGLASLALGACSLLPSGSVASPKQPARSTLATQMPVSSDAQKCLAQLGKSGSKFSPIPDRYYGAGCSTLNAVRMDELRSDLAKVQLSNLGPLACPAANRFAGWARFGVDRAAKQMLGSELVRIETMGSYSCRNISGSSRRSAHSTAEAVDVSGFVLADGRRITVSNHWSAGSAKEREFLRVILRSACKRFGTVLGPEYNAAHRDHFHLELISNDNDNFCR